MEAEPRVYITAFDPTKNLRGAAKYGALTYLLKNADVGEALPLYIPELRDKLKGIRPSDYLVLVGDPLLIAAVASIAAYYSEGKVTFLKWDRMQKEYFPVKVDLNSERGESHVAES